MEIEKAPNEKVEQKIRLKHQLNDFFIKYFNLLVLFLIIIILSSGYLLIIKPKYKQTALKNQLEVKDLEIEYINRQKYLDKLKKVKEVYESIKTEDREKIEAVIPTSADVEQLITEIESMAIKNGLILASLSVKPESDQTIGQSKLNSEDSRSSLKEEKLPANILKVKISMKLLGVDYSALKNISKTIENNLRLMDLKKIDYNPTEGKLVLDILTYYLKSE